MQPITASCTAVVLITTVKNALWVLWREILQIIRITGSSVSMAANSIFKQTHKRNTASNAGKERRRGARARKER